MPRLIGSRWFRTYCEVAHFLRGYHRVRVQADGCGVYIHCEQCGATSRGIVWQPPRFVSLREQRWVLEHCAPIAKRPKVFTFRRIDK